METIRDRVELLVIDSNLTKTKFATIVGIDPANFAKKLKGMVAFTPKDLSKISKCTGAAFDWLQTGEGARGELRKMISPSQRDISGTPFYNVDFMGGFMDVYNDTSEIETFISVPGYDTASCWCTVSGNSMAPVINPGDIIALKQVGDWASYINYGEIYGIVTRNDMRTIKIIRKGSDEMHYRLIPVNTEEYDEQEIDKGNILYVFKVIGAIKKF